MSDNTLAEYCWEDPESLFDEGEAWACRAYGAADRCLPMSEAVRQLDPDLKLHRYWG